MELLGAGRMAEVFAMDEHWAIKLDRPEFTGIAAYEADILGRLGAAGLPVPRVRDVLELDGRTGFVMERLHGPTLTEAIENAGDPVSLAEQFVELHLELNSTIVADLPDLTSRLAAEIGIVGLHPDLNDDLLFTVRQSQTNAGGVAHFDFHPTNVVVTTEGWRVVDWLGVATGPTIADFARTLLLMASDVRPSIARFRTMVYEVGARRRGIDSTELASWVRVVAAARLAEGFEGGYADWLRAVASGESSLGV